MSWRHCLTKITVPRRLGLTLSCPYWKLLHNSCLCLCFPDSISCLYFHGPRIFSFLGSPLQLKLHFYSFKDLLRPPQRIQHIASPNYFSSTLTQDSTIPPALQIHTLKTSTTRIMMSIIMRILSVLSAYWETCPLESQSHENLCFFKADSGKTLPWVTIMKQGKP